LPIYGLEVVLTLIRAPVIAWDHRTPRTELHHDPPPNIVDVDIAPETEEGKLQLVIPRQGRTTHYCVIYRTVIRVRIVQVQGNVTGEILAVDQRRARLAAGAVQPGKVPEGKRRGRRGLCRNGRHRILPKAAARGQ